jgi:plasmid stabilization system protein ParE
VRIERHPAVIEDDLPDIYAYIARDRPDAAERLLEAVADTFDLIAAHPESGILYPARRGDLNRVRLLPVAGWNQYLIFYRIDAEVVRILYVVHGVRHLPRLFEKERRA